MHLRSLLALILGTALAASAHAASVSSPNPQQCQIPGACIDMLTYNQSVNAGVPGFTSTYVGKNYLDNGDFLITQRGTAVTTGGTTSGPAASAYVADRWAVNTNVTSGAGRGQVVTSVTGVTLQPGLPNAVSLYRNSGALTQPVSLEQFVETSRFRQLQGKPVILSCGLAANAGAPTGVTATFHLFTGTGSNEGLGASTIYGSAVGMTASPALTPVLTGLATAGTFTTPALTSTVTRYSSAPIAVPLTATEGVFEVDFTPGAETAGTTDGIVVQGCQLEQADPNQTVASALELLPPALNLARAQRFFWQITDSAATTNIPSSCNVTTANTTVKCGVWLPTQMAAAPATTVSTATSFGIWLTAGTAGTCTTLAATASSNTVNSIGVTCTTGGTIALGTGTNLIGAATAGTLSASADF